MRTSVPPLAYLLAIVAAGRVGAAQTKDPAVAEIEAALEAWRLAWKVQISGVKVTVLKGDVVTEFNQTYDGVSQCESRKLREKREWEIAVSEGDIVVNGESLNELAKEKRERGD